MTLLEPPAPRAPLVHRVLAVILFVWEPVTFALTASRLLVPVLDRGWMAAVLLVLRLGVTALGLAAGLALWRARPGAVRLARVALLAAAATTLLTWLSGALPHSRPPGLDGPALALTVLWYVGWAVVLRRKDA